MLNPARLKVQEMAARSKSRTSHRPIQISSSRRREGRNEADKENDPYAANTNTANNAVKIKRHRILKPPHLLAPPVATESTE